MCVSPAGKSPLDGEAIANLQKHMDELFTLPPTPLALPRAYWLPSSPLKLTSALMLLTPSEFFFTHISTLISSAKTNEFDMEIVNTYSDQCMVLPHRGYIVLTGEFQNPPGEHTRYLGVDRKNWNGTKILEEEVRYVHFSDWPVPKPWLAKDHILKENMPKCWPATVVDEKEDCGDQKRWLGFYDEYKKRRKVNQTARLINECTNPNLSRIFADLIENFLRLWETVVLGYPAFNDFLIFLWVLYVLKFQTTGVKIWGGGFYS
jgi:alpha-N-acetylglucosamine transferase